MAVFDWHDSDAGFSLAPEVNWLLLPGITYPPKGAVQQDADGFRAGWSGDNYVQYRGQFFQFDGAKAIGGTITTLSQVLNGDVAFKFSGLNWDIADIIGYHQSASKDDDRAFGNFVFAGNDSVKAGGGSDYIDAGAGRDTIKGNGGDDRIRGGTGADKISGGRGNDTVRGGSGDDTFVFDKSLSASNFDKIVDFKHNADIIALERDIFGAIGSSLTSSEFYAKAGATSAHDGSDHIIYNKTTGKLYYDKDGKGGASAVHFATLSNKPQSLDHGDFDIV